MNRKKYLLTKDDVAEILECSPAHAYKVIHDLNDQLRAEGYATEAGKIPKAFFAKMYYGFDMAQDPRKEQKMVSKDKENNTWIAQWYETDAYGRRKKKCGFKTLREAKQFEYGKTSRAVGSMSMLLSEIVEVYFEDKENELKP